MNIVHFKIPFSSYHHVRDLMKKKSLDRNFIYHKAASWGHLRIESDEIMDETVIPPEWATRQQTSFITNRHVLQRLKNSVCFQGADQDVGDEIETLFLYDIFHLYGFASEGLFFGRLNESYVFGYRNLPQLPFFEEIMQSFCREKSIRWAQAPL